MSYCNNLILTCISKCTHILQMDYFMCLQMFHKTDALWIVLVFLVIVSLVTDYYYYWICETFFLHAIAQIKFSPKNTQFSLIIDVKIRYVKGWDAQYISKVCCPGGHYSYAWNKRARNRNMALKRKILHDLKWQPLQETTPNK